MTAAPVYPIDLTTDELMADKDCVCLNTYGVRKMLNEDIAEVYKEEGNRAELKVAFNIVKSAD